jgi:hypothetical protein
MLPTAAGPEIVAHRSAKLLDVLQGQRPVVIGFTTARQIEVGSVQNEDIRHGVLVLHALYR